METKPPFTKAVVAIVAELSFDAAVGANGAPVNVGEAKFALRAFELSTYDLDALADKLPFTYYKLISYYGVELELHLNEEISGYKIDAN
mgnify:CR=1 FL=1